MFKPGHLEKVKVVTWVGVDRLVEALHGNHLHKKVLADHAHVEPKFASAIVHQSNSMDVGILFLNIVVAFHREPQIISGPGVYFFFCVSCKPLDM